LFASLLDRAGPRWWRWWHSVSTPAFSGAYFDTGTIYDVLAYAFFWGAFAWYVSARRLGPVRGAGGLALPVCLLAAALDSKEVSVTLPVAVALYELVWHPPADWKIGGLWRWIGTEGRFAAIGFMFDVAFVAGKKYGSGSLWDLPAYHPHFSVAAYIHSLSHYLSGLLCKPLPVPSWQMSALLAMMAAIAALSRRRSLIWGIGFILVGILPLAFIPGRAGSAYLVPSVGWAVYCTSLLDWIVGALAGTRIWLQATVRTLFLVLLFGGLAPWQRSRIAIAGHAYLETDLRFLHYRDQIHELIPTPRKGARILLLADADGIENDDIEYLIRSLTAIHRSKRNARPSGQITKYKSTRSNMTTRSIG
jgi:hypothetical protein